MHNGQSETNLLLDAIIVFIRYFYHFLKLSFLKDQEEIIGNELANENT